MTNNNNQQFADLINSVLQSFTEFANNTDTLSEPITMPVVHKRTVGWKTSGKDDEWNLQAVVTLSEETLADVIHFVTSAIVTPIVCILGMAGNLLSIITWGRPGMRSSTGRYLTGQAVANIGLLLMFLLCDSLQHWSPKLKCSLVYATFYSYLGYPMLYFTVMCSIWFTVGLTIDRYIMVCWITKAKNLCSESRATFSLNVIAISSFIINIPHFISYAPVYPSNISISDGNYTITTVPKVAYSETEFEVGEWGLFYEFWIHCMFLTLIPWLTVFTLNIMIIYKIAMANKRMADKKTSQALKKSKMSENQVTRLLMAVTFTFIVVYGLQCITHCLCTKKPPGTNWLAVSASFAMGKAAVVLNASLNFLLYCLTGRRFRVELLKILGLSKKDEIMSSLMNTSSSNISATAATPSIATRTRGT